MNSELHNILVHVHSIGRWVLLILLLVAIYNNLVAGGRPFNRSYHRTGLLLTITADLMLLIGIALWFMGPFQQIESSGMSNVMKNSVSRFFAVEHTIGMIIAVILIHIGKAQAKKQIADSVKHRRSAIYYVIALIIILVSVPWPFLQNGTGRGWF